MGKAFNVGVVPFNSVPLNVPFSPFSRSDKLGRIADWTRNFNNPTRFKNPADSVFDFTNDDSFPASADDDASFRLVDGKPPPRPKFDSKWRYQQQRQLPQRRDEAFPPLLILQTPIYSSNHKHLCVNFIPKFHSQMKRSIPVWHISPVYQSGNGISLFFLRN
ncbi:hypothetical protein LR48_Vigan284s001700 [Vigna angularis]|uniref:Uncharacterized protein n=1 Tax=Phaseolus angularis TaxID=3914 RepID=A0A0L9T865_PHAAN|nr:hypothetical protein LR48_Vigan284s001700 [Vigna angularis]